MQEKPSVARAGKTHTPIADWKGLASPSQESHPCSQPFRPRASAIRTLLLTPHFSQLKLRM